MLSRRAESRKESTLIKEIWENVTAEEISDGKYVIKHKYKYRHDVSKVFPPWKSNIIEARKQAKKVIYKAKLGITGYLIPIVNRPHSGSSLTQVLSTVGPPSVLNK